MSDVYHNPKTGEVWEDGKTYPSEAAYTASKGPADDTRLGAPVTGLLHQFANGATYGVGDKVLAGIDAASSPDKHYDSSLANIRAQGAQAEKSLPPGAAMGANIAGTVVSPLSKLGAGVKGGTAALGALYAAGNSQSGPLQTAKEMGEGALSAPIVGRVMEAVGNAPGAIKRYIGNWMASNPKVADMMARRLVGTPTEEAVTNLLHGEPGQYADTITKLGLHEPMSKGGRVDQAKKALQDMGPEYSALREGKTVPGEDVSKVLDKTYPGAQEANRSLANEKEHFDSLAPATVSAEEATYQKALAAGYPEAVARKVANYTGQPAARPSVPLQDVGTRIAVLKDQLRRTREGIGSGRDVDALKDAIGGMERVQGSALSPEEQGSLADLNKRYAVGTSAAESTARESLRPPNMMRRGAEGMLAAGAGSAITHAMGLGPLPGAAAGLAISQTHPVARAALKAYADRFNAPNNLLPAVAKAAAKASPALGTSLAKALDNEDSQDAAVELYKAQATDQKVRKAVSSAE